MKDNFPAYKTEGDTSAVMSGNAHTTLLTVNSNAIGHTLRLNFG